VGQYFRAGHPCLLAAPLVRLFGGEESFAGKDATPPVLGDDGHTWYWVERDKDGNYFLAKKASPIERRPLDRDSVLAKACAPVLEMLKGQIKASTAGASAQVQDEVKKEGEKEFVAAKGALEGRQAYDVVNPATGKIITDIDDISNGVLWEEKSAAWADNIPKWIDKQITQKLNKYMEARKYLPGYESAPIGFRFTGGRKLMDDDLAKAILAEIDRLKQTYPGIDIRLEW
jgi:hypothetical protein